MVDGGLGQRFEISYSRWNRRLMGLLGIGPRFSRVEVGDVDLRVRMGWAFDARIAIAHIERAAVTDRPFLAWGVHGWRGRWLVNGSSQGIVTLDLDPHARGRVLGIPLRLRTVSISLVDPEGFLASVRARSTRLGA